MDNSLKALEIISNSWPIAAMIVVIAGGIGIVIVNRIWAHNAFESKKLDNAHAVATNKAVTTIDRPRQYNED